MYIENNDQLNNNTATLHIKQHTTMLKHIVRILCSLIESLHSAI